MEKKSKRAIVEVQRVRQKRVRDQARERRRPSRDDLARVLLWQMVKAAEKSNLGHRKALDGLRDKIVDGLELQGFDVRECEDVFDDLVKRYANGVCPFRRKRHLEQA